MIFRQVISQSTEPGVVLKHVVTLGNALLVATFYIILHRLLPTVQYTWCPRHTISDLMLKHTHKLGWLAVSTTNVSWLTLRLQEMQILQAR